MANKTKLILLFLAIIIIGFGIYFFSDKSSLEKINEEKARENILKTKEEVIETNQFNEIVGLNKGSKAPEFTITTLEGKTIRLSELTKQKKPLVLYFFATWCPNCMQDLSVHKTIYPLYEDKVAFVAVDLDSNEKAEIIKRYVQENGFVGDFAIAHAKVLRDYNVRYTTTKYVIDKEGKIVYAGSGPLKENEWKIMFDTLLA